MAITPTAFSVLGGGSNGYAVTLTSEPAGDVTVTASGHAGSDLSLDKTVLIFTTSNWNTAQTIIVSADDDAIAASVSLAHAVASTADSVYDALSGPGVSVTVVYSGPVNQVFQLGVTTSPQFLAVPEGGSNTYSVVLSRVPSGAVTVTITDPTDNTEATASPDSLTFTTSNWNTAQIVTVSAAEDDDAVADPVATVTHSLSGGGYADVSAPDVAVTIIENDSPSIVLTPSTLSLAEGDSSGETYTVELATQPSASVTVTVSGHAGSDVSLDKTSLTFTTSNWNTAQTVTVKAAQDAAAADDTVSLTHTAATTASSMRSEVFGRSDPHSQALRPRPHSESRSVRGSASISMSAGRSNRAASRMLPFKHGAASRHRTSLATCPRTTTTVTGRSSSSTTPSRWRCPSMWPDNRTASSGGTARSSTTSMPGGRKTSSISCALWRHVAGSPACPDRLSI